MLIFFEATALSLSYPGKKYLLKFSRFMSFSRHETHFKNIASIFSLSHTHTHTLFFISFSHLLSPLLSPSLSLTHTHTLSHITLNGKPVKRPIKIRIYRGCTFYELNFSSLWDIKNCFVTLQHFISHLLYVTYVSGKGVFHENIFQDEKFEKNIN